jgi:hypothetical protein
MKRKDSDEILGKNASPSIAQSLSTAQSAPPQQATQASSNATTATTTTTTATSTNTANSTTATTTNAKDGGEDRKEGKSVAFSKEAEQQKPSTSGKDAAESQQHSPRSRHARKRESTSDLFKKLPIGNLIPLASKREKEKEVDMTATVNSNKSYKMSEDLEIQLELKNPRQRKNDNSEPLLNFKKPCLGPSVACSNHLDASGASDWSPFGEGGGEGANASQVNANNSTSVPTTNPTSDGSSPASERVATVTRMQWSIRKEPSGFNVLPYGPLSGTLFCLLLFLFLLFLLMPCVFFFSFFFFPLRY